MGSSCQLSCGVNRTVCAGRTLDELQTFKRDRFYFIYVKRISVFLYLFRPFDALRKILCSEKSFQELPILTNSIRKKSFEFKLDEQRPPGRIHKKSLNYIFVSIKIFVSHRFTFSTPPSPCLQRAYFDKAMGEGNFIALVELGKNTNLTFSLMIKCSIH